MGSHLSTNIVEGNKMMYDYPDVISENKDDSIHSPAEVKVIEVSDSEEHTPLKESMRNSIVELHSLSSSLLK